MIKCAECGAMVRSITHTHLKHKCSGRFRQVHEYAALHPDSPIKSETSRPMGVTLENMIHKHREIEGTRRWEVYRQKQRDEKWFFFDFCFEDAKIIIEYNGDYWHANPALYDDWDVILVDNNRGTALTAGMLWQKDARREQVAKNAGYDFITVWERDTMNDFESSVQNTLAIILAKVESRRLGGV